MYAVVAPGFNSIYTSWKDVERVIALYPYPKWCKCNSEEEAYEFIKRNKAGRFVRKLFNYGNTSKLLYINAKYRIGDGCVYYVLDTKRFGSVRVVRPSSIIEYKGSIVYIKDLNFYGSDESIASHMSAIFNLLEMLGSYCDINLTVPYFSIYYCLTSCDKEINRSVSVTRNAIDKRLGSMAFSLDFNTENESEVLTDGALEN